MGRKRNRGDGMTHPYKPGCCALPASDEVHDWLKLDSRRLTEGYSWAMGVLDVDPDFEHEFLAMCVTEMAGER
jgi:disulfide oxidoreductase YuzD